MEAINQRLKNEQEELEALYKEKKIRDLENLDKMIKSYCLDESDVLEAIQTYAKVKNQAAS